MNGLIALTSRALDFFGVTLQGDIVSTVRAQLERPVVRASAWSFGGYGAQQVLRFANNLILTRLLFPEAFGILALVQTVIVGLNLFSDTGVETFIIQNPIGEEPDYLRTGWTISIIRGFALSLAAALLAGPIARFYGYPELRYLIPVVGLNSAVRGFQSMTVWLAQRRLRMGKIVCFELLGQVSGLALMIALAVVWKSVWVLVIGMAGGALVSLALSHILFPDVRMRLRFSRPVAKEMFRFGRWIFISTVLTFVLNHLDRILLGRFMTADKLGLYSIALMLATFAPMALQAVAGKVLLPVYSNYMRMDMQEMRRRMFRIRFVMMALTLPPIYVLMLFGSRIVQFLYDDRYYEAGWMLQVLAAGAAFSVICASIGPVLLAAGDSFAHAFFVGINVIIVMLCLGVGGWASGGDGIVVGRALSMALYYVPLVVMIRKHHAALPLLDAAAIGATILVAAAAFWVWV